MLTTIIAIAPLRNVLERGKRTSQYLAEVRGIGGRPLTGRGTTKTEARDDLLDVAIAIAAFEPRLAQFENGNVALLEFHGNDTYAVRFLYSYTGIGTDYAGCVAYINHMTQQYGPITACDTSLRADLQRYPCTGACCMPVAVV
jgi:hypothetical protein